MFCGSRRIFMARRGSKWLLIVKVADPWASLFPGLSYSVLVCAPPDQRLSTD